MSLLSRLESRFGRWAIPNVTMIIIAGQALLYCGDEIIRRAGGSVDLLKALFLPGRVLGGEIWRPFTFVFYPPGQILLFVIFYWMLLYLYGSTLERHWGTVRFNSYLFIAYAANVIASILIWIFRDDGGVLLAQLQIVGITKGILQLNGLLLGTIFLAFARIFPDYVIRAYFILPIRIKWLALLVWLAYGYAFVRGDWTAKLLIFASIVNYLIFFGLEHIRELKHRQRKRSFESKAKAASKAIRHQCEVCEKSSENSPKTLFRYCSKCAGQSCYCPDHIQDHEHIEGDEAQEA